jgi:hypothetical protein
MKNRICLLALLGMIATTSANPAETPEAALTAHMRAISSLEADQILASQHFPFTHLWHDGRSDHVATAAEFTVIDPSLLGPEWHHSVLDDAKEIARADSAVTYLITFSRLRADDSLINSLRAVWVVTKVDGDWRVQFRHGVLPLE